MDPNRSMTAEPDALFAYAVHKYHTDYFNGVLTEVWGLNTWMQVQANINGISSVEDAYFISGDALDNTWRMMYSDVLGNLSEAIRLTSDSPADRGRNAVYRIYRAYIYHRLTDLWGDIPYSEAHNVINGENEPDFTPSYDSQSSVYDDLLDELAIAASTLEDVQTGTDTQDWLYQGEAESWRRFAHSLRLRLAIRISEVDVAHTIAILSTIQPEMDLILADSHVPRFPHSNAARSPFFELHATSQGMYNPTEFLVDLLESDDDPRISRYAEYTPQSEIFGTFDYVGVPSFVPSSSIDPSEQNDFTISYIGDYFLQLNAPRTLMSSAEVHLLLAEAALHGWVGGTPQSHYENGVRSHCETLEIPIVEINDYLELEGAYDGTLEQLITEKWKTFVYTDAVELYSEWRRTGFPILLDSDDQMVDVSTMPLKLAYPQIEHSLNAENVPDDVGTVWWDVD